MFRVKIDTTWSATQVGPRRVESGLGGHEEGVFGVDEGSRTHRSRSENGDERHHQIMPSSVNFPVSAMKSSVRNATLRVCPVKDAMLVVMPDVI